MRKALGRLFRAMGLRVQTFVDCASFLAFLEAERPDCLILDLDVDGSSGVELLEAMRTRERAPPSVVIAAHVEPGTLGRCLRAGASVYLRKPLESTVLVEAVAEALGGSRVIVRR